MPPSSLANFEKLFCPLVPPPKKKNPERHSYLNKFFSKYNFVHAFKVAVKSLQFRPRHRVSCLSTLRNFVHAFDAFKNLALRNFVYAHNFYNFVHAFISHPLTLRNFVHAFDTLQNRFAISSTPTNGLQFRSRHRTLTFVASQFCPQFLQFRQRLHKPSLTLRNFVHAFDSLQDLALRNFVDAYKWLTISLTPSHANVRCFAISSTPSTPVRSLKINIWDGSHF